MVWNVSSNGTAAPMLYTHQLSSCVYSGQARLWEPQDPKVTWRPWASLTHADIVPTGKEADRQWVDYKYPHLECSQSRVNVIVSSTECRYAQSPNQRVICSILYSRSPLPAKLIMDPLPFYRLSGLSNNSPAMFWLGRVGREIKLLLGKLAFEYRNSQTGWGSHYYYYYCLYFSSTYLFQPRLWPHCSRFCTNTKWEVVTSLQDLMQGSDLAWQLILHVDLCIYTCN